MGDLHCGDCLDIMRDMPSESIDLIATDPPFNTGKDWGQFNDKWEGGLDGYLKFMKPRLEEMYRLLKDTGSLYLHCDTNASHYLKVMLDGIFGMNNFRNEIVWKRTLGHITSTKHKMPISHDIILFYAKTSKSEYHLQYTPLSDIAIKQYKYIEDNKRRYKETIGSKVRGSIKTLTYLDIHKGIPINTLWLDIDRLVNTDYPTQKPMALYDRIIKASSNQGDTVLDPFCGSGTTLDSAKRLGRKWIGIDQNTQAIAISHKRLHPEQMDLF